MLRSIVIELRRVEVFPLRRARRSGDDAVADLMPVEQLGDGLEEGTAIARVQWFGGAPDDVQYKSADYQEALKIGQKYATFRRYAD